MPLYLNLFLFLMLFCLVWVKTDKQKILLFGFTCLAFAVFLFIVIKSIFFPEVSEICGDFNCYYYSAELFGIGINPYNQEDVVQQLGFNYLPYKYSPLTLYFFKIFSIWDYWKAMGIFNLLKLSCFIATIAIWVVYAFKDYRLKTFILLITIFGFNQTAFLDFTAGNIAIFEVFAFTIAIIFLTRNNTLIYYAIILFLALFKIQIAIFLFLALINFEWKKFFIVAISIIAGVFLFYLQYQFMNKLFLSYINELAITSSEIGQYEKDMGTFLIINKIFGNYWNYLIYFSWTIFIFVTAFLIFKNFKSRISELALIAYSIFAYVLITPRFTGYTFVFLIVPSVFAIHFGGSNKIIQSLLCLLVCTSFLGLYQPIIVTIILFIAYIIYFYREDYMKITFSKLK